MSESLQANNTGWQGNFQEWTDDWLKKSGANTLRLELTSSGKLDIV